MTETQTDFFLNSIFEQFTGQRKSAQICVPFALLEAKMLSVLVAGASDPLTRGSALVPTGGTASRPL